MAVSVGEPASGPMPHLCLKWNNYQMNLSNVFDQLLQSETFVDVTLAAEGQTVKAHKMVLSACSPYFQALFNDNPCPHPIIILKDTKWVDLKSVVEYMYKGEISVAQNELSSLLKVADNLKIRGLSEMETSSPPPSSPGIKKPESPSSTSAKDERPTPSPRPAKRRRSSGDQPSSTGPASPAAEAVQNDPSPSSFGAVTVTPVYPHSQQNSRDESSLKPGIEDLIREEERAKAMDAPNPHMFPNAASPNPSMLSAMDAYNMQLQAVLWQRAWAMHQTPPGNSPMAPGSQNVRFRERGPFKTWRPETMAEAIMSVLREGLSLSQAARKFDIPYPTFVLYANRVNNMLGPPDGGQSELRTKGRGRPQRILTGQWAEDHVQGVIRAVVFRDPSAMKDIKLEGTPETPFPTMVPPSGPDYSRAELMSQLAAEEKDQRHRNSEGVPKQFEDASPSSMRHVDRPFHESSSGSHDFERNMHTMAALGSMEGQQMNGLEALPGPSTSSNEPSERQACMYESRDEETRLSTIAAMTQRLLVNHGSVPSETSGVVSNEPVEELESTFDPAYLVGIRVKQEQELYDVWK